jgi:hypothetical protein
MRFLMSKAEAEPGETLLVGDPSRSSTSRNAGGYVPRPIWVRYADCLPELRGDEEVVDAPADIADLLHAR